MTVVSVANIQALRVQTGVGMMDCKKALQEADGDMEKAVLALRAAGEAKADRRVGRSGAEGLIVGIMREGVGCTLVEVRCETDFVARSDDFRNFVTQVAEKAADSSDDAATLLQTGLEQARLAAIQRLGEDIQFTRVSRLEGTTLGLYVHGNGRIGSAVALSGGKNKELAHGLAMHVAAEAPLAVSAQDIPADLVEKERQVYLKTAMDSGRPAEIQQKMIEGKLRKFVSRSSLLDQEYVVQPDKQVKDLVLEAEASVKGFIRLDISQSL